MDFSQLPILIGNGPSVKDHEWGEIIDTFGTVIRVNSFPISGFEAVAGTRCDVWVVTPTEARSAPACREIIAFVISPDRAAQQREYAISHYSERLTLVDRPEVIHLAAPFGYANLNAVWPSTGATAIIYLTTRYPFVVYHGFDHLVGAEAGTPHYFPTKGAPLHGVHDPKLERGVFETIVARGQAAQLADLLREA